MKLNIGEREINILIDKELATSLIIPSALTIVTAGIQNTGSSTATAAVTIVSSVLTYLIKNTTITPQKISVNTDLDGILNNPNEYAALERLVIHEFGLQSGELKQRRRQKSVERGKPIVIYNGQTNTNESNYIANEIKKHVKGWK